jgi:hypothetical protein
MYFKNLKIYKSLVRFHCTNSTIIGDKESVRGHFFRIFFLSYNMSDTDFLHTSLCKVDRDCMLYI